MPLPIFCTHDHLVLDAPICPECGWKRPRSATGGTLAWGPAALGAGLGGPGRGVLAAPAASQGVVVFPLKNGELVGLDTASGSQRWRRPLDLSAQGCSLAADGRRLLASLSDMRELQTAGNGRLAAVNPLDGELETLWQADSHQVSQAALSADTIFLRTSGAGLFAFERKTNPTIKWKVSLRSWWPLAPFLAGDYVLLSDRDPLRGEPSLCAYHQADGAFGWEYAQKATLSQAPAANAEQVFLIEGDHYLQALELAGGKPLWSASYERFYASLCAGARLLYVCVRGAAPAGEPGHYQLLALDTQEDGRLRWKMDLPAGARPRSGLLLQDGLLLMSCDNGRLLAYEAQDGEFAWMASLGSADEPPRSRLLAADGLLFSGNSHGAVTAVHIATPCETPCSYQEYLERGEWEAAAGVLALAGEYSQAGALYETQLQQPRKALLLYEMGQDYKAAGLLARSQGKLSEARQYFQKAGLPLLEAEVLLQSGDHFSAARIYETLGEYAQAAQQYELAGELRKAYYLYRQAQDYQSAERLRPQIPYNLDDIETLEQEGRLVEAGDAAFKSEHWARAADLFQRAEDPQRQVEALEKLVQSQPEEQWAWERLVTLARSQGNFALQAQAYSRLGQPLEAAQAMLHAARQKENLTPEGGEAVASLYEMARHLFAAEGYNREAGDCWQKVIQHRKLPWVIITRGETNQPFVETENNTLVLVLQNTGFSVANHVRVLPESDRFELDRISLEKYSWVEHLAAGKQSSIKLFITPKQGQVGLTPLVLNWSWQDRSGVEYRDDMSWPVHVNRLTDSAPSATPVEIHYHAPVYHSEGAPIEIIGGDKVSDGGHKGHTVQVGDTPTAPGSPQPAGAPPSTGADQPASAAGTAAQPAGATGTTAHTASGGLPQNQDKPPAAGKKLCPICSLEVDPQAQICDICGNPLQEFHS